MKTRKRGSGTTTRTICGLIIYVLIIPSASAFGAVLGSFLNFYLGKATERRLRAKAPYPLLSVRAKGSSDTTQR